MDASSQYDLIRKLTVAPSKPHRMVQTSISPYNATRFPYREVGTGLPGMTQDFSLCDSKIYVMTISVASSRARNDSDVGVS